MSDIKERLRDCNKLWTANEVRFEAADYIKQLETQLAALQAGVSANQPDSGKHVCPEHCMRIPEFCPECSAAPVDSVQEGK